MDGRTKLEQRFLLCLWLDDVRLLHQAARLVAVSFYHPESFLRQEHYWAKMTTNMVKTD